ncbi:MAG: hypothetical protein RIB80_04630 [Rhodospirillales bacterium]
MKRITLCLFALALLAVPAAAQENVFRPVKTHYVPYTATAQAITDQLGAYTDRVQLVCTTDCYYSMSTSGAATGVTAISASTTQTHFLPANTPVIQKSSPGGRISVVRVTSDGALYVTEMSR